MVGLGTALRSDLSLLPCRDAQEVNAILEVSRADFQKS